MTGPFRFTPTVLPPEAESLRADVRRFLAETRAAGLWASGGDFATHWSEPFSRAVGARGWIGMTWSRSFGGGGRSMLERFVVTEELLAAGAPVAAHWIGDRQSGPLLLRYGTPEQCRRFLPGIIRGEAPFCIGMSEPDAGSDLAALRTRARADGDSYVLAGRKIWTSNAQRCRHMIVLCRTGAAPADLEDAKADRHAGLSQLLIDMDWPGVGVRPIRNLAGNVEFNEVIFDDVRVPADRLVGKPGEGWAQVTSELAYERSGPERFLSTFRLFAAAIDRAGPKPDARAADLAGRHAAMLWTLRGMSRSVAGMLGAGAMPNLEAALVKDLGNTTEQALPELVRSLPPSGDAAADVAFDALLRSAVLYAPSFSLRGGTREILRGIIARGLGLR